MGSWGGVGIGGCGGGGEVHEGEDLFEVGVEDEFVADLLEDVLHGFEVEALAGEVGCALVGLEASQEGFDFAGGFGFAAGGEAFGLADEFVAGGASAGEELVAGGLGLVFEFLFFLDGGVDAVEGGFDAVGGDDALHLEAGDGQAAFVAVEDALEVVAGGDGDGVAFRSDDFVEGVVADQAVHDGACGGGEEVFGEAFAVAGGELADEAFGFADFPLDGPLDAGGVEVAGEHEGFFLGGDGRGCGEVVGGGVEEGGTGGESDRAFLDADLDDRVGQGDFEVESGGGGGQVFAEAEDDGLFVGGDGVGQSGEEPGDQEGGDEPGEEGDEAAPGVLTGEGSTAVGAIGFHGGVPRGWAGLGGRSALMYSYEG